jgi:hypothetical protein
MIVANKFEAAMIFSTSSALKLTPWLTIVSLCYISESKAMTGAIASSYSSALNSTSSLILVSLWFTLIIGAITSSKSSAINSVSSPMNVSL